MIKFVSFLAIGSVLSISSVAAAPKKPQASGASSAPVQTAATQNSPRKRGNAAWAPTGPGCKMSGRC